MSKYLSIAIAIITFILGLGIGYMRTPEYAMTEPSGMSADLGRADNKVDLRYINAMISHHKSAMVLADQVKNQSQRSEIKDLANKIIDDEPKAIDALYALKKELYNDSSKVKDPKPIQLGSYDEKLDLRFLNALISHHQEGLDMVADIQKKSRRNEILNNADAVKQFLETTLETFESWRSEWYGIN